MTIQPPIKTCRHLYQYIDNDGCQMAKCELNIWGNADSNTIVGMYRKITGKPFPINGECPFFLGSVDLFDCPCNI